MNEPNEPNDPKSWKELFALSSAENRKLMVSVLTALNAAKEVNRGADGALPKAPPIGDFLFDLAKLHMATVGQLASIGSKQAGTMVDFLKDRRSSARGAAPLPARALVSPIIKQNARIEEAFFVSNSSPNPRTYPLPSLVIELVRVGGGPEDSVFVEAAFQPDRLDVPGKGKSAGNRIIIAANERLEPGRYQARIPVESPPAPPIELIIELKVIPGAVT